MNETARNPAKPKKALKNGKVYGDILSAEEKKRIVAQKKKGKKGKKIPKSAQQTIPYVEMCRDGICKVNSRLYTKTIWHSKLRRILSRQLLRRCPSRTVLPQKYRFTGAFGTLSCWCRIMAK